MTTYNLSAAETLSATSLIGVGVNGHYAIQFAETLDADDAPNGIVQIHGTVAETGSATDYASEGTNGTFQLAVSEKGRASDSDKVNPHTFETLSAQSHQSNYVGTPGHLNLTVTENGSASDIDIDPETFSSVGLNFWGYKWAYDEGITSLAVYCAGLDCGDHGVDSQGKVFVPWQSDADGLFTPGYLMNMSSNLSGDVIDNYGATAVNIDLTDNSGNATRVIVDLATGVPYSSQMQLVRPNTPDLTHNQFGPSLAEIRRIHQFGLQLVNAQGLSAGTDPAALRPIAFIDPRENKYPVSRLFSGIYWNQADADYNFDNMLMVEVHRPWPCTIAAIAGFFKTFDRSGQ
jgi:hypothetical protein